MHEWDVHRNNGRPGSPRDPPRAPEARGADGGSAVGAGRDSLRHRCHDPGAGARTGSRPACGDGPGRRTARRPAPRRHRGGRRVSDVVDASALLAFLQGETGADTVEEVLTRGPDCSAVNWSEVAQKVGAAGGDWPLAAALLSSYGVRVRDATVDDAERAAALWCRGRGSRSRTGSASRWAIGWTQHLGREQGD